MSDRCTCFTDTAGFHLCTYCYETKHGPAFEMYAQDWLVVDPALKQLSTTTEVTPEIELAVRLAGVTDLLVDIFVNAVCSGAEGQHSYYATIACEALAIAFDVEDTDPTAQFAAVVANVMAAALDDDVKELMRAIEEEGRG